MCEFIDFKFSSNWFAKTVLFSVGVWFYIVLVPHSNEGGGPDYLVVGVVFDLMHF